MSWPPRRVWRIDTVPRLWVSVCERCVLSMNRGGDEGVRIRLHTHIYASDASSHSHLSAKSHTWTPVNSGFKRFFFLKIAKFSLKSAKRAATRAWQTNSEPGRHGRKYSHFRAASSPRRRGAAAPATRTVARVSHLRTATGLTLTLTPPNRSHTHISHPRCPPCAVRKFD